MMEKRRYLLTTSTDIAMSIYQVYNMLKRLYPEDSMSWKEYLNKVLDANFNASWKVSLIDASNGKALDIVANVARTELK
jgi:hypothetical protein